MPITVRRRRPKQLELVFRKPRKRKVSPGREGFVPHRARPKHHPANPVHVTMRARPGVVNLRSQRGFHVIQAQIRAASRDGFRVTHFSVQANHIHAIVEATDRTQLARGVQRLAQRLAWDVNALSSRSGSVWRDRYHRRDLTTARAVRNAIVYVIFNIRKHTRSLRELTHRLDTLDICSSAAWLDGWDPRAGPLLADLRTRLAAHALAEPPVAPPTVWLAREGWKQHGLLAPDELPAAPR
jgi:putative transposase